MSYIYSCTQTLWIYPHSNSSPDLLRQGFDPETSKKWGPINIYIYIGRVRHEPNRHAVARARCKHDLAQGHVDGPWAVHRHNLTNLPWARSVQAWWVSPHANTLIFNKLKDLKINKKVNWHGMIKHDMTRETRPAWDLVYEERQSDTYDMTFSWLIIDTTR